MFRQELSIVIDRPLDDVWAMVQDMPFIMPRARTMTLAIRKTSQGPIGLGTTMQQRLTILGFEMITTGAVTEWDSPHGAVLSVNEGGIFRSGKIRFRMEPSDQGTKLTRVLELEPRGIVRLLWPILGPYIDRRSARGFRNLKRLLETTARVDRQA